MDRLIALEQGFMLILATLGVRSLGREAWPLVMSLVAVSASYMAVASMAVASKLRFIVPMMPLVVTLSAIGFEQLVEKFGRRMSRERKSPLEHR